jgi:hypothetical protein
MGWSTNARLKLLLVPRLLPARLAALLAALLPSRPAPSPNALMACRGQAS